MKAKLTVAYDGAPFHGFAVNPDVATVAGTLNDALSTVVRRPVELTGAGRTDAGVHAWGQVVSVELPDGTDLGDVTRRLNKLCAPSIAVRAATVADDGFDARFSASWRKYRYDVWNAPAPNPLLSGRAWHVVQALDVEAMSAAASHLVGEHDFSSFCRRPDARRDGGAPSLVRRVLEARWTEPTSSFCGADPVDANVSALRSTDGRVLRFDIRANAFCHQMVRSIVGTLVDVGLGRFGPADVPAMLEARDRSAAGRVAPPHGLTLWEVGY